MLKSITTVLHRGYIWQRDATDVGGNILVSFLVVYFLTLRATLAAFLTAGGFPRADVAVRPHQ